MGWGETSGGDFLLLLQANQRFPMMAMGVVKIFRGRLQIHKVRRCSKYHVFLPSGILKKKTETKSSLFSQAFV